MLYPSGACFSVTVTFPTGIPVTVISPFDVIVTSLSNVPSSDFTLNTAPFNLLLLSLSTFIIFRLPVGSSCFVSLNVMLTVEPSLTVVL